MPRKPAKKGNVNIQRISEQRILDDKLLKDKGPSFIKIMLWALGLGALAGAAVVGYIYYSAGPAEPAFTEDQIVIPEVAEEETASPDGVATSTPTTTEPDVMIQEVEILDTPTGFLNVRSGPGTNFAQVGRVNPGETYELVSQTPENGGWYQIALAGGEAGWVFSQYAQIVE